MIRIFFTRVLPGALIFRALIQFRFIDHWILALSNKALDFSSNHALNLASIEGPVVTAFFASVVGIYALNVNSAVNIRNKKMDVIIHCNNRYDDLYKIRIDIEKEKPKDNNSVPEGDAHNIQSGKSPDEHSSRAYFRRYWGLKSDQLDYWFAGYVDPETIASWFMFTVDSISKNSKIADVSYAEDWVLGKKDHEVVNQRLVEMMDFILNFASRIKGDDVKVYAVLIEYLRILEWNERVLIDQLSRNRQARYKVNKFSWTLRGPYRKELADLDTRPIFISKFDRFSSNIYRTKFVKGVAPFRSKRRYQALKEKILSMSSYS